MLLQTALNGRHPKAEHLALPVTPEELAFDAAQCVLAGSRAFHVHPRRPDGAESLEAEVIDVAVAAIKSRQPYSVGVSTGAWIESDERARRELVARWTRPDHASVNLSEPGAIELMQTLLDCGIGIEAGVWTVEDAQLLVRSGLADRLVRVLVEPIGTGLGEALPVVAAIHQVLDRGGVTTSRLQHGDGPTTWPLLEDSVRRGIHTRIGFEDTRWLPNGGLASSNAALVEAARALGAGEPE